MRRSVAALLLAPLLSGCAEPVFVPEAGPGAPGYTQGSAPPPPDAEVVRRPSDRLPAGGAVDTVVRGDGTFEVSGWAHLDADPPRGVLQLVLPKDVRAEVVDVETMPRADVVDATGTEDLLWAGFTVTVRGSLPENAGVCVLSRSGSGEFQLSGSDPTLCPA